MPFTPWIQHPLNAERVCRVCGLRPLAEQVSTVEANTAYTHQGAFLTTRPLGRIEVCTGSVSS